MVKRFATPAVPAAFFIDIPPPEIKLEHMRTLSKYFPLIAFLLAAATTLWSQEPLRLQLGDEARAGGRLALSRGDRGELFVLVRDEARLLRIDPSSGQVLWQIDGSEAGEAFIDPAWISRPDGFFVYLTDRGTRKVWRVDYRGELRGAVDLSFASDPRLLELSAGGQMIVYDRASGLVHLLDDSGQPLWNFPPGEGRTSAEPSAICVGPGGQRLFLLWSEQPRLTVVSLSGRGRRRVNLDQALPDKLLAAAAAGDSERTVLAAIGSDGVIYRLDVWSGKVEKLATVINNPLDIRGGTTGFSVLSGEGPAVHWIQLEGGAR